MIFIVVVGLFIMAAVGGMIYLATRFRKFIPEKIREKLGKKKSFLILLPSLVRCLISKTTIGMAAVFSS